MISLKEGQLQDQNKIKIASIGGVPTKCLHVLSSLNSRINSERYYSHFTDEDSEVQGR